MTDIKTLAPRIVDSIETLTAMKPPKNAIEAVWRIRQCREAVANIVASVESQVMESLCVVRREHPEKSDFIHFIQTQLDDVKLNPEAAWRWAVTWETARGNRDMRELTQTRPAEAVQFVQALSVGVDYGLDAVPDAIDRIIGEILALAPRERHARLRKILHEGRDAMLSKQSVESPAMQTEPAARPHPRFRIQNWLRTLRSSESLLSDALRDLAQVAPGKAHAEARLVLDGIIGVAEEILSELEE